MTRPSCEICKDSDSSFMRKDKRGYVHHACSGCSGVFEEFIRKLNEKRDTDFEEYLSLSEELNRDL